MTIGLITTITVTLGSLLVILVIFPPRLLIILCLMLILITTIIIPLLIMLSELNTLEPARTLSNSDLAPSLEHPPASQSQERNKMEIGIAIA